MYILLLFLVVLLVFSWMQNNKRRKHTATLQQAIEPGARVVMTSGIFGIVSEVEADTIVIEISEGVDVRFKKAAVMSVVPDFVDETADVDDVTADVHDVTGGDHLTDADIHAELDALGAHDSAPQTDPPADGATKPPTTKPATGREGAA